MYNIFFKFHELNQKPFYWKKKLIAVGDKFWIWRIFSSIKDLGVNRKLKQRFYKKNNKAIEQG